MQADDCSNSQIYSICTALLVMESINNRSDELILTAASLDVYTAALLDLLLHSKPPKTNTSEPYPVYRRQLCIQSLY